MLGLTIALAALTPAVVAQPVGPGDVGGPVNEATGMVIPVAENQTGEDLSREQIDVGIHLHIVNAEFDMVGVMLGGGKAQTDLEVEVNLAFYAVNVSRLETAIQRSNDRTNASLNETFGVDSNRTVLTAEQIRTAGGGELLRAFKSYQEDATARYIEETVPQMTVLSTRFSWQNTEPGEDEREEQEASPREPPIVLNGSLTLRFLDRYSLEELAGGGGSDDGNLTPQERLEKRIQENQSLPFQQQSAFDVVGISQLLALDLPSGWRLNLTVTVPQGFTIEQASDTMVVTEDRRTASYFLDGSQRSKALSTSGLVTLSDRSLVTTTFVGLVLVAGFLVRLPIEMGVFAALRRWGS